LGRKDVLRICTLQGIRDREVKARLGWARL
jgi:hypothetical protein